MKISLIEYNTQEYQQMVTLRDRVLRKPLGLTFSKDDLEKDKNDYLLIASTENTPSVIIGCCILTPVSKNRVQLRQMAVDENYRGRKIGEQLLTYAEQLSSEKKFTEIYLHAREIAIGFYEKEGYSIIGDTFTEVGISHCEMLKILI